MTKLIGIPAFAVALLMGATAATAGTSHRATQDNAAVPSPATLDAVTDSAWRRFNAIYKEGGMSGLVDAVQGCYANTHAQRLQTLKCLQIDYFARSADVGVTDQLAGSLNPQTELRTPYFEDDVFKARRETYTSQLASDQADDLSAALLIHGQNKVQAELGGSGR